MTQISSTASSLLSEEEATTIVSFTPATTSAGFDLSTNTHVIKKANKTKRLFSGRQQLLEAHFAMDIASKGLA